MRWIAVAIISLMALSTVFAQETNSTNATVENPVVNETPVVIAPQEPAPIPKPEPKPEPKPLITDFRMTRVFPTQIKTGDTQMNLEIINSGTAPLENLGAIVTGKGIAVTNIEPIDRLEPGQQGLIIVFLSASQPGVIQLNVKILNKDFKGNIKVVDPQAVVLVAQKAAEAQKTKEKAAALNAKLENLSKTYEDYDHEYIERSAQQFIFPAMSFADAKQYLRTAQAALTKGDLSEAEANMVLVESELGEIRNRLNNGKLKEKTWNDTLRENVPWIATTLSAIVAIFAIIDNVKKHRVAITEFAASKHEKKPVRKKVRRVKKEDQQPVKEENKP